MSDEWMYHANQMTPSLHGTEDFNENQFAVKQEEDSQEEIEDYDTQIETQNHAQTEGAGDQEDEDDFMDFGPNQG